MWKLLIIKLVIMCILFNKELNKEVFCALVAKRLLKLDCLPKKQCNHFMKKFHTINSFLFLPSLSLQDLVSPAWDCTLTLVVRV